MTLRGLRCAIGLYRHDPERIATVVGFAFRCSQCGTTATTEAELLGDWRLGYVTPGERAERRRAA